MHYFDFHYSWEQRKLGDVVDVRSGKDYKHLSEGNIPVYGTGGFMLSVNQALSYDEDAIGIGRKGTIDKPYILKAPFWTVDTLFYAIPREKVDLNFAFDVFQNIDWKKKDESTGVPSLSKTAINEIDVLVPQYDEQQPLGQFFNRIDNLITLHQREFAFLCKEKSKKFRYIKNAWEQCKLGDVCSRVQGNDGRMELPTLTISAGNGWMRQEDRFSGNIAGKEQKNYTLLRKGELSYNHGNSKLAKYGTVFSLQTYEEALVPRVYHSFKVKEGNCDFVEYYFATKLPDRELSKLISSGARMDGLLNIGYDEFMGIQMKFPSTLEQRKISLYFRKLDHLITLHQREFAFLCKEKSKKFRYIKNAWEQRKLGEIGSVSMCRRIFKEQTSENGEIPFYKIGTFGGEADAFISRELFEEYKAKYQYPKKGDILISASGSIGRTVVFTGKNEYFQDSNIVWLNHDKHLDNSFLKCFYSIVKWAGIEGSTIKRLYNDNILNTAITLPSVEEQQKIGAYFENLDNLITLHQRKPVVVNSSSTMNALPNQHLYFQVLE